MSAREDFPWSDEAKNLKAGYTPMSKKEGDELMKNKTTHPISDEKDIDKWIEEQAEIRYAPDPLCADMRHPDSIKKESFIEGAKAMYEKLKSKDEDAIAFAYENKRLKLELEKYGDAVNQMMKVSNELMELRNMKEDLKKLYDWIVDENRQKAQTFFTASEVRNIAKEVEFKIKNPDK